MKEWLKNAVFYEIYPQSFNDTNADGIGDFNGIIEKLDYIKEMGFTAIWMNPCFDSPFNDAGYDVRDYYTVAARYGTNEDIRRLFEEAHKRDIRIMLDLVPGHTSVEHEWFLESQKPERNEYSDRYVWTDEIWTDINNVPGIKGVIRGISDRNGACGVNFYSSQPALNYGFAEITEPWQCAVDSPAALATREAMLDVIRFWLKMGCDGFRVDMAGSMVKNDKDESATIELWQQIFAVVNREFPQAAFIAEWGNPVHALKGGFDMDFLLTFGPSHYKDLFHSKNPFFSQTGTGSAKAFFAYYLDSCKQNGGKGFMCIPSGNHDIERLSYFCDDMQMKLVYAFMMSMPGVPFIYYGDEIGMRYLPNVTSVEGGYRRTGTRSPMQWDDSVNSGFSTAKAEKLYVMQDPDEDRPTVEKQWQDDESILQELKRQIAIRKQYEVLQESAGIELITCDYPLVYKRFLDDNAVLIAINPKNEMARVNVENLCAAETIYSFNGEAHLANDQLTIPPLSATYIRLVS